MNGLKRFLALARGERLPVSDDDEREFPGDRGGYSDELNFILAERAQRFHDSVVAGREDEPKPMPKSKAPAKPALKAKKGAAKSLAKLRARYRRLKKRVDENGQK